MLESTSQRDSDLHHLQAPSTQVELTSSQSLFYLQFTVFRGEGSQVGVAGLVKELRKEGPRELLGCEWVLEEQGLIRLAPTF